MSLRASARYSVTVVGSDPVSEAGLAAQLRGRSSLDVGCATAQSADVVVLSASANDVGLAQLRKITRNSGARVVVIVDEVDDQGVLKLVEEGAAGVVRRTEATPELLEEAVGRAARGEGTLPGDLLGGLLRQVKRLQSDVLAPQGLNFSGLSNREISVLSMIADGLDTKTIASELCYSERTIKNIIQDVMRRFGLRNRSHAVAFALREGLI